MSDDHLQRDLIGYGRNPPDPQWPNDARVCVSFVVNYEEGGENTVLNGDAGSETYLTETSGPIRLNDADEALACISA